MKLGRLLILVTPCVLMIAGPAFAQSTTAPGREAACSERLNPTWPAATS